MQQNPEIYFVTIIGIILGLMLVGFIVTILLLYQRRQQKQEKEILRMKDQYEKEALLSQLEIQENTFKTIAQELHDNIGQLLSVVKITLSAMPIEKDHKAYDMIMNSQKVLHKAVSDLSNLTKSLHTERIIDLGLEESIRFELDAIRNAGIIRVDFHSEGEEYSFDSQKAIFLFRIFQETLNNSLKHSEANELTVRLRYRDDYFHMEMRDNGKGFNINDKLQKGTPGSGVGLRSLYNRASIIGAKLKIESNFGIGTSVSIKLPSQ